MAQFLLKRSDTPNKRPVPGNMVVGELDLNYDQITGGVYYKNTSDTLSKVGAAQVSTTAPNASPAGSSGNALGESWFDTTACALKIWNGANWCSAIPSATTVKTGSVHGCTTSFSAFLGCNAGGPNGATVVGNVAIGAYALCQVVNPNNTAIGYSAMCSATGASQSNTALGHSALSALTTGCYNTALGQDAGGTITTGSFNVAIGIFAQPADPAGSNQLHIGCYQCYWLRGDSTYNIRPGAGIRDCTGALGTAGQVLSTTGSALLWRNGAPTSCQALVNCGSGPTGSNCLTFCGVSYGMWGSPGGYSFVFCAPSNTYWGWTTCAQNASLNSCIFCGCSGYIANSGWKYFNEGLSLATNSATQSATFIQYPNNTFSPATAIYCFLGVVGSGYCNNMICVTRIF